MVQEIKTVEDFKTAIGDKNTGLVVIDFFADWCGPCKMIAPKFHKMSEQHTSVGFYKVNSDNPELQDMCSICKVQSLPSFCFFRGGKYITKSVGADDKQLAKLIVQYTPKSSTTKTSKHDEETD